MSLVVPLAEHQQQLHFIDQDLQQATRSIATKAVGTPIQHISMKIKPEFDKRRAAQMHRWPKSKSIYELKPGQIAAVYQPGSEGYNSAVHRLNKIFGK
jgi:hypothetical protein